MTWLESLFAESCSVLESACVPEDCARIKIVRRWVSRNRIWQVSVGCSHCWYGVRQIQDRQPLRVTESVFFQEGIRRIAKRLLRRCGKAFVVAYRGLRHDDHLAYFTAILGSILSSEGGTVTVVAKQIITTPSWSLQDGKVTAQYSKSADQQLLF